MAGQPEGGARNAAKRAAGIVVLRRLPAGWQCLLLRAYRNWDFPKGLVEEGEMPLQAALREVREEPALRRCGFPGAALIYSALPSGAGCPSVNQGRKPLFTERSTGMYRAAAS